MCLVERLVFGASDGLFSLCVSSRHAALWFGSQSRLTQNHHVILCRVERLVDPVHAAGHVTGVAGDQHQVADGEQESSSPEEETALLTDFTVFPGSINIFLFFFYT